MKRLLPLLLIPIVALVWFSLGGGEPATEPASAGAPEAAAAAEPPAGEGPVALEGPAVAPVDEGARAAVEQALPQQASASTGRTTISGRVVDGAGEPIAGARVGLGRGGMVLPGARPREGEVEITGADGRFRLPVDDEDGRRRGWQDLRLSVSAASFQAAQRTVSPAAGTNYPVGDLELLPGSIVAGRVVGPNGEPVVGAILELLPAAEPGLFVIGPRTGDEVARSAADGSFRSDNLPEGPFELRITHPEHPDHRVEGVTNRTAPAQGLEIRLPLGVALEGRVDGDLAGRELVVKAWHEGEGGGQFRFGGMGDGPSFMDVVRKGEVQPDGTFRVGGLEPDRDLKVAVAPPDAMGQLAGPVVEAKAPASGLVVPLHAAVGLKLQLIDASTGEPVEVAKVTVRGEGWGTESKDLEAGSEGHALIERLPFAPGTAGVLVSVAAPGYKPWTSAPVTLPATGFVELGQAPLNPGPAVLVELYDRVTDAPVAEARVSLSEVQGRGGMRGGMRVSIASGMDGEMVMNDGSGFSSGPVRTDAEGKARLAAPAEGRVRVRVLHEGYADLTAEADIVPPTTAFRLPLDRPGIVVAQAVDASGAPVPGARIEHAEDEARGPMGDKRTADAEGRVRFTRLRPGVHRFRIAKPEAQGMVFFGMNDEQPKEEDFVEVEVLAGSEHEVTLSQQALAVVTGKVTIDGEPLAQAKVTFEAEGKGQMFLFGGGGPSATTDGEGSFRLEGLDPGAGELVVEHTRLAMKHREAHRARSGTQRVDLPLTLTTIEGQVRDEAGRPVEGARVSVAATEGGRQRVMMAFVSSDGGGAQVLGGPRPDRTGPDGRYRLEGVRSGVPLEVSVEGAGMCPASRKVDALDPGELEAGVDFEVLEGATLVVRRSSQEPLMVRATFEGEGPLGEPVMPEMLFLNEGEARKGGLTPGIWNLVLERMGEQPEVIAEHTVELLPGAEETVDL
jgi:protocatechuate 3,4-dioxygenase beta subunit